MLFATDRVRAEPGFPVAASGASEGYKPHIDGLRAVSILAVLGFHAGVSGFGGGFVGVDVFFVISGFLIINQIVQALAAGRFSIWDFYARRGLRILPPYYLVLLVTLAAALVLIRSPRGLDNYVGSATLAPIFLSNVYFLVKSGYFDIGSRERPLLHSWSLSVEEQFYLIAPLILIGVFALAAKRGWKPGRGLAAAATVIGVASFLGCIHFTLPDKNSAFYLTQWRAWEFVAGGAVGAFTAVANGKPARLLATLSGLAGLLLIVGSVVLLGRFPDFPGFIAAAPVLGAVLLIHSGLAAPRSPAAWLLSTAPFVFVGRISYALYLWHWPLLVFGRLLPIDVPFGIMAPAALALSFLLATATHLWLERPILAWRRRSGLSRDWRKGRRIVLCAVAAAVALSALTGALGGLAFWSALRNPMFAAAEAERVAGSGACLAPLGAAEATCLDGSKPLGVIVGDSHALAILPRVEWQAEQAGDRLLSLSIAGCNPVAFFIAREFSSQNPVCVPLFGKFEAFTAKMGAETTFAVFAGIWNVFIEESPPEDQAGAATRFRDALQALLQTFADGRRLLVVGPVPELAPADPLSCVRVTESFGLPIDHCGQLRSVVEARRARTVAIMKAVVASFPNARFIDPIDVFCDERTCLPIHGGVFAYRDNNHLNDYGAKLLYERFRDDFEWAFKG